MNLLKKIPHDKLLHFLAGFLCVITLGYFLPWFAALWIGCLIGMMKEAYDAFTGKGNLETWDFFGHGHRLHGCNRHNTIISLAISRKSEP